MVGYGYTLRRTPVLDLLWHRLGTTHRGVLMKEDEKNEQEDKPKTPESVYSDEYCDVCECDPCDCNWGNDQ